MSQSGPDCVIIAFKSQRFYDDESRLDLPQIGQQNPIGWTGVKHNAFSLTGEWWAQTVIFKFSNSLPYNGWHSHPVLSVQFSGTTDIISFRCWNPEFAKISSPILLNKKSLNCAENVNLCPRIWIILVWMGTSGKRTSNGGSVGKIITSCWHGICSKCGTALFWSSSLTNQ